MDTVDPRLLGDNNHIPTFAALPLFARATLLSNYDWTTDNIEHLCAAVLMAQAEHAKLPSNDTGSWFSRSYNMWKDLDDRMFRLLHSDNLCRFSSPAEHIGSQPFVLDAHRGEDSDLDDDEADGLFPELNSILAGFKQMQTRSFLVVRPLNARQRRCAHAVAQFSHFGHMSIGTGVFRMLLVSRRPGDLPSSLKKAYKNAGTAQTSVVGDVIAGRGVDLDFGTTLDNDIFGGLHSGVHDVTGRSSSLQLSDALDNSIFSQQFDSYPGSGYTSADSVRSFSSRLSAASARSNAFDQAPFEGLSRFVEHPIEHPTNRKKRKRQPGAYPCVEPGCSKVFDRQCDLSHHQRSHISYSERPYPCEKCERRFLFHKDLARHLRTHQEPDRIAGRLGVEDLTPVDGFLPFMQPSRPLDVMIAEEYELAYTLAS